MVRAIGALPIRRGAGPPFRPRHRLGGPRAGFESALARVRAELGARLVRVFFGGTYDEVARWLWNFLTAHAKRENVRAEVELESGEEREGKSYAARVRLGERISPPVEFEFGEVASHRGSLEWCATLAARVRGVVRDLGAAAA